MTQEEIKAIGQKATTDVWKEFSAEFNNDDVLKRTAYNAMQLAWQMYKDRIPMIDSEAFWQNPVAHLTVFEVIRRQCVAYSEIYEKLWKDEYCKKYGHGDGT